jgi:hypothetical protein
MTTVIETAPALELRPQDVNRLVDELRAYRATSSAKVAAFAGVSPLTQPTNSSRRAKFERVSKMLSLISFVSVKNRHIFEVTFCRNAFRSCGSSCSMTRLPCCLLKNDSFSQ